MDTVIVIADGWGSKFGGINSFNYSLCKAMGKKYGSQLNIICVVPNTSSKVCSKEKSKHNLKLISLQSVDFNDEDIIIEEIKKSISIIKNDRIIWVGHDIKTGFLALKCCEKVKESKCAIIHHMSYKEYYTMLNNNPDEVEEKRKQQRKLLNQVDYVIANGPKLMNSALDLLENNEINTLEVIAGLAGIEPKEHKSNTIDVITFGRIENETNGKECNSIIKQTNLAVASWASFLKDNRDKLKVLSTTMEVIGYTDESIENGNRELKKYAEYYSGGSETIVARRYIEDQEELFNVLRRKSLCLMLSREEGFGLTGLEAISAGVPVIISRQSGLYQFLKDRRLDNYILSIEIRGSYAEPYFSGDDLKNVKEALFEIYNNYPEWKKSAIDLKNELLKMSITWESCAENLIELFGCSTNNESHNNDINEFKKDSERVCIEKDERVIKYKQLGKIEWFDRDDVYKQMNSEFVDKQIVLIEGFENSGKVITTYNYLKSKRINDDYILYYDAIQQEDPKIFLNEVEEYIKKFSTEDTVYLMFDNFTRVNNKIYYDIFIQLTDEYKNLCLFVFSETKFQNVRLLRGGCSRGTIGRLEMNQLSVEDVRKYFLMYEIEVQDEEIEKIKTLGYLPIILGKCVDYILDEGDTIESAVKKCASLGVENIIDISRLNNIDNEDIKLASVLSQFEKPFSKNIVNKLVNKLKLSEDGLSNLVKNRVILSYGDFSYYIPPFYSNYYIKQISPQIKKRTCVYIAEYYYEAYKHEWRADYIDPINVMRGINACRYMQKAEEFKRAEYFIFKSKYKVYPIALKKGYYDDLIDVLKKQMELQNDYYKVNDWCRYSLIYCLLIVGRIYEAKKIMNDIDLSKIEDKLCRLALLRLECNIKLEFSDAESTLSYLEREYNNAVKTEEDSTVNDQLDWLRIELYLENKDFLNAGSYCEKHLNINKKLYETVVASTYLIMVKIGLNESITLESMYDIQKKFEELEDERGKGWILGIIGTLLLEKNPEEAEKCIIDSISIRRNSGECSRSYREWLAKLCKVKLSDKIQYLLKHEQNRMLSRFSKEFLPKELIDLRLD